jgi:S-adenosylmethionine synthetase
LVNPSSTFVKGGPEFDCGLTGRKIIVDTYGGVIPHGGGAFSGKDPTKVDRSGAYVARYLAKNIVAAKLAKVCTISIAYAIGIPNPISISVDTNGTGVISDDLILKYIKNNINLSVSGVKKLLQLTKPIYRKTCVYSHFGKKYESDGSFSWEKLDLVEKLKSELLKPEFHAQVNY